ncbi:unnamed protein product [Pleuronectes platessa]|uniref:Uncharacterized protein n=1 Tax=Pleuronectes platessa TaxID=8262 RepID=A0A9N7V4J1_PLEPL|nr:unnamed protein product [Pleuronectes platessa]
MEGETEGRQIKVADCSEEDSEDGAQKRRAAVATSPGIQRGEKRAQGEVRMGEGQLSHFVSQVGAFQAASESWRGGPTQGRESMEVLGLTARGTERPAEECSSFCGPAHTAGPESDSGSLHQQNPIRDRAGGEKSGSTRAL